MLSLPLVVNGFSNTEFGVSNPLSISPCSKGEVCSVII